MELLRIDAISGYLTCSNSLQNSVLVEYIKLVSSLPVLREISSLGIQSITLMIRVTYLCYNMLTSKFCVQVKKPKKFINLDITGQMYEEDIVD